MRADALLGSFGREERNELVPAVADKPRRFPEIVRTGTKSRIFSSLHWVQGSPLPRVRGAQSRFSIHLAQVG